MNQSALMRSSKTNTGCYEHFLNIAKLAVHEFRVDDENREVVNLLYLYATRNPQFEQKGYSLDKGLMLIGNVGTGKTGLIKTLQRFMLHKQEQLAFALKPAWEVAAGFGIDGYEVFSRYRKKHWCFDELGLVDKETIMHFGNKLNVSEMLILERYNLFTQGYLTHFTTNLSDSRIKEVYDLRTYSRLKEMCNFLVLIGTDRRRTAVPRPLAPAGPEPLAPKSYNLEALLQNLISKMKKGYEPSELTWICETATHYQRLDIAGAFGLSLEDKKRIYAEEKILVERNAKYKLEHVQPVTKGAFALFTSKADAANPYEKEVLTNCRIRVFREYVEKQVKR